MTGFIFCSIARAVIKVAGDIAGAGVIDVLILFIGEAVVGGLCSKFEDCFERIKIAFFFFERLVGKRRVWVKGLFGYHFFIYV